MDPVLSGPMIAFHTTMVGMQVLVILLVYAIRSKMDAKCGHCPASCVRRSARRGWTLILAAVSLMLCRTILILARVVPRDEARLVVWVFLPLCITMLFLMGLYDLLMCEETRAGKGKWTS